MCSPKGIFKKNKEHKYIQTIFEYKKKKKKVRISKPTLKIKINK